MGSSMKMYHLFCIDCDRGWHLADLNDFKLLDVIHEAHRKLANPKKIKCGNECANDWAMVRKALKAIK